MLLLAQLALLLGQAFVLQAALEALLALDQILLELLVCQELDAVLLVNARQNLLQSLVISSITYG